MTEGRIVAGAAAGSYLVLEGRYTHNSAQDDLDAGHGGCSAEEEVKVYCAIVFRLALLLRHAHSWCV